MKNLYIFKNLLFIFLFGIFTSGVHSQTWQDLGELSVGGNEINFINVIVGYDSGLYLCSDLGLFRTTDNGATFTNLTYENGATTGLRIYSVFFDDTDNTLYAGGDDTVFKSTNNGATWTATGLTGSQIINAITRSNGNLIASYGDTFGSGGAYYSSDGFATFTQSTGLPDLRMIGFYSQDNLLFLAGEEGVYGSVDDGVTWALQGTGHENVSTDIKFIKNGSSIFVADRDGSGLYKTDDNGATWFEADPVTFANFCQVFDITLSNGVIYVVTDGVGCANSNEPIKISSDNGVSWSSGMFNLSQAYFAAIGVTVDGCVFTYAPFEDKLYRLCDGPLSITEANTLDFKLYPNPTEGTITVSGLDTGSIAVYSMQGIQLKDYTEIPANNTIDISEFATGIYFVTVRNERGAKTFKILKD
jgi:photosystem II stability/assembly factor-like uncharacterized protein